MGGADSWLWGVNGKVGRATDALCLPIRPGHRSLGESRRELPGDFSRGVWAWVGGADYWRKGITGKHGHGDQGLLPVVLTWALVAPGRDYRVGMPCRDGVTHNVTEASVGARTPGARRLPRSFGRVANALCLEALRGHWPRRAAAVGLHPIALVVPVLPPGRAATRVSLGRAIQDAGLLPKPGRGAADAFCLSL